MSAKFIVIEGCDFSGKSTLAERLKLAHMDAGQSVEVIHNGQLPEITNLTDYYLAQLLHPKAYVVIMDRLHVSELIYGTYYRDASRIDEDGMQLIDRLLDKVDAIRIWVNEPDHVLLERFRGTRGDDLVLREQELLDLAAEYRLNLSDRPEWLRWSSRHTEVLP